MGRAVGRRVGVGIQISREALSSSLRPPRVPRVPSPEISRVSIVWATGQLWWGVWGARRVTWAKG